MINVIKSLLDDFELKPYLCKLLNIEFGLNLEPFGDINKLLDGLVEHKGKKFDSSSNGNFRECEHSDYKIKIYNKSEQCKLQKPKLRYEIHFNKMRKLRPMKIETLKDLIDHDWTSSIIDYLLKIWDEVLLIDYTLDAEFNIKRISWLNPNYWKSLSPMQKSRERKKMNEIILSHSRRLQLNNKLRIESKWNDLRTMEKVDVSNSPFNYRVNL